MKVTVFKFSHSHCCFVSCRRCLKKEFSDMTLVYFSPLNKGRLKERAREKGKQNAISTQKLQKRKEEFSGHK